MKYSGGTFLGIDVGTSAVKTVLIDQEQNILAQASRAYDISRPRAKWSEQCPELWWRAVEDTLEELAGVAHSAFKKVTAIGLSGQMHGAVLLGDGGKVLRPAILWNDGRADEQAKALHREAPGLADKLGVLPMPGFTAPKIAWVRENEPELFARIERFVLPKDYIRFKLTGQFATDMSDAAGTWLLDQKRRGWSSQALAAVGLDVSQAPRLVEGPTPTGELLPEVARKWGVREDVVVVGGGGDSPVGAVGVGGVEEGDAFINLGTSALLFVTTKNYRPAVESMVHSFCHCLPERWHQMAAMLNGASALAWFSSVCGEGVGELVGKVEARYDVPGDLQFLPYLGGERTPHNNPDAKGVFFGLTPGMDKIAMAQAVMEGVAFSFADAKECLERSGTIISKIALAGGGGKSPLWARMIAATMNTPLVRYAAGDAGPAFGAARLAIMGLTGAAVEEVCTPPRVERVIDPEPELVEQYAVRLEKYRRLYALLKEEFSVDV